jgi:hypothetical protein
LLPEGETPIGLQCRVSSSSTNTAAAGAVFSIEPTNCSGHVIVSTTAGTGSPIYAECTNTSSLSPGINVKQQGKGDGIQISKSGSDGFALRAVSTGVDSDGSTDGCIYAQTNNTNNNTLHSTFWAHNDGKGYAGWFETHNAANDRPCVTMVHYGTGSGNIPHVLEVTSHGQRCSGLFVLVNGTSNDCWAGNINSSQSNGVKISTPAGKVGLTVLGGTKNAVVKTSRGATAFYSEESSEVWFSDYGTSVIDAAGTWITIDPIFLDAIDDTAEYHVFLQSYGCCNLSVTQRLRDKFFVKVVGGNVVNGDKFSYRIVGKRKNYKAMRLEHMPSLDNDVI